ncbi:MAG: hypothetical protein INQ03_13285 [Candidatus Heimdallarchaeota archaeon]|nr:hypothetical protein [Candidatus Heimdallarchaeota archaeon]
MNHKASGLIGPRRLYEYHQTRYSLVQALKQIKNLLTRLERDILVNHEFLLKIEELGDNLDRVEDDVKRALAPLAFHDGSLVNIPYSFVERVFHVGTQHILLSWHPFKQFYEVSELGSCIGTCLHDRLDLE